MRCRHALPALLLPALLLLPACVVQAPQPELPPTVISTTVYLMSAEGHTGLLLPGDDGVWTEFCFGDYGWYAEGRSGFNWTLYTAFADSAAALGRRDVGPDPFLDSSAHQRGLFLYPYTVSAQAADVLRGILEEEFARGGEPNYNPLYGVYFVRARVPFSMWFNCTDATASWLLMLGIEVPTGGVCKRIVGRLGTGILPQAAPPDRPPWE